VKKWGIAVLMAVASATGAAAGPERAMVLWPGERMDAPHPWIFYKDRPCRLPIAGAPEMREYTIKDWPEPLQFVGCWGYSLQDGMLITVAKYNRSGVVSRDVMPTFYLKPASVDRAGVITRLP